MSIVRVAENFRTSGNKGKKKIVSNVMNRVSQGAVVYHTQVLFWRTVALGQVRYVMI